MTSGATGEDSCVRDSPVNDRAPDPLEEEGARGAERGLLLETLIILLNCYNI